MLVEEGITFKEFELKKISNDLRMGTKLYKKILGKI